MPDNQNSEGRRRRRRRRGGNPSNPARSGGSGGYTPQQTGFQKVLSVLTFGLLGKPKAVSSSSANRSPAPPVTFEGGNDRPRNREQRGDRAERAERREQRGDRGERSERGERPAREPREPREPRGPKPGESVEVTSGRLYVGNLSYDATESDLFELFNGVGKVQNAEVVVNNRTQRSKGFAFITMATVDEARRAVAELDGKDFMGRPLQVSGAKPAPDRDESSTSSSGGDASSDAPSASEAPAA